MGFLGYAKVACTQPRRVAATSLARRVALEVGCSLGTKVGFQIRHDKRCNDNTQIKFMTDGIFLLECLKEDNLRDYSAIILDEVHERTLNMDTIFGLVKQVLKKRMDLKVIVTSATMNSGGFAEYFDNAPSFEIPGRQHDVQVFYSDYDIDPLQMTNQITKKVVEINLKKSPGDILVFMTGKLEIEEAADALEKTLSSYSDCDSDSDSDSSLKDSRTF